VAAAPGADLVTPNYYGNAPFSLATVPAAREAITVLAAENTYELDMSVYGYGDSMTGEQAWRGLRTIDIVVRPALAVPR
jgi:hypothetical protein